MKIIVVVVLLLSAIHAQASEASKAQTVLSHLNSVGYNGKGYDKLPVSDEYDGWSFKKIGTKFYDVTGPGGRFEYEIANDEVQAITWMGGHQRTVLYDRKACQEIYDASLTIKAEEYLYIELKKIFEKHKVKGLAKNPKDIWYSRNYSKNCKLIFALAPSPKPKQTKPVAKSNN